MSEKDEDVFGITVQDLMEDLQGIGINSNIPIPTEIRNDVTARIQKWVLKNGVPNFVHLFYYPEDFEFDPIYYETDSEGKFLVNPELILPSGELVLCGHSPAEIGIGYKDVNVYDSQEDLIEDEILQREKKVKKLKAETVILLEEIEDLYTWDDKNG